MMNTSDTRECTSLRTGLRAGVRLMLGLLVMAVVMLALIGLGWLLVYLRFGPAGLAPAHWTPLCDGVVLLVFGLVVGCWRWLKTDQSCPAAVCT